MARVLVITEHDSLDSFQFLAAAGHDAVVLGFWLSKDAAPRIFGTGTMDLMRLNDAVGDYSLYVEKAYFLAHTLGENSPLYRGVKPLATCEEFLADAILRSLMIGDLHKALIDRFGYGTEVVFLTLSETQEIFSLFNTWRKAPFRIVILRKQYKRNQDGSLVGRIKAFGNLIREAHQDGNWAKIFWTPLEVLDYRYLVRSAVWPEASVEAGGRWFYGSFISATNILHRHLDNLEGQASWVLGRFSAIRGLKSGDHWYYLWQFGKPARAREHRRFLQEARKYLETLPSEIDRFPIAGFITSSPAVNYFLKRMLPLVLANIDLMHVFLERSSPQELWVANQWGSEGELIQVANKMGIPVTQVQHGALHRYYANSSIYSERFFVWGQFWRDLLKSSERGKVEVFNPGLDVIRVERKRNKAGGKHITFLTSPLDAAMFWNPEATLQEVSSLIRDLVKQGYTILMRIHPSDQISLWRRSLEMVIGSVPQEVQFSKGGSLDSVLQETDLALMFFSTVFLNCIASGIPVIGLGWYPHIWRKPLEKSGVIHFADSIPEVMRLVESLLQQPSQIIGVEHFLAPVPPSIPSPNLTS